ncbi:formyltetrahydrofolate deformylase [Acuticoccus kandeliae]|uniref:formyltetrahydrofolate deformylase n=1 Tax=Acuticoccus kandeliae TaxID=2073160 RepID=UPI000D3E43B2|nr:formyltetrahydrofolate deformylase [Acuticoccus kandeliae]
MPELVLTLSCIDRKGIVGAVGSSMAAQDCNILESAQYYDRASGRFFMRVHFQAPDGMTPDRFRTGFRPTLLAYDMDAEITDLATRPRVLVMVSKTGHCLNDLLYRWRIGQLPMALVGVASNHEDWRTRVESEGIPFHHLPITPETKAEQEAAMLDLVEREGVELIILARYMQILSDQLSKRLEGRVINIHHSFLPSFKGAMPYHQAHARGVKLIGATAHYVTPDLDEGPIIEQDTERVDHTMTPDDLVAAGRDIESRVLARAVRYHLERRILLNGDRTIVFK